MADHFNFARLCSSALDYASKNLEKVKQDTPVEVWDTISESLHNRLDNPNQSIKVKRGTFSENSLNWISLKTLSLKNNCYFQIVPEFQRFKPDQTMHVLEQGKYLLLSPRRSLMR